jgi:dihydroorotase (homodimeric type)
MYTVDALCNVHSHLREGAKVMMDLARLGVEGGADTILPMPNTGKGLSTAEEVDEYGKHLIQLFLWSGKEFPVNLIKTVMLNERTTAEMIDECVDSGILDAKIYPLDRTTKSHNGVRRYEKLLPLVKHCGKMGMKVHFHPEHPNMLFDNRDAEFAFLPIGEMFLHETEATIVWEHGTDGRCIPFWKEFAQTGRFYVTLTAHHLVTDEDESFGDVRAVCKPPVKTRRDRMDLVRLVEEDWPWVMAGLDDAPHDAKKKHPSIGGSACGAYTAPFGLQLYAHALDEMLVTRRVEGVKTFNNFISRNARRFHGLPEASRQYRLVKKPFLIPNYYQVGEWTVESFWAGRGLIYSLEEV